MLKKVPFSLIKSSGIWMMIVVSSVALLVSACGGSVVNSSNLVPTTVKEVVSSVIKSTDTPLATANPKPSSTSSSPLKVDACTLLTKDEVSKVLGQTVDEVTGKGLGGVCSYKTKDLSFDLTVSASGGIKYLQDTRAKIGDNALDVPGLGDGAFYNTFSNTLFLRKGDAVYLFNLYDSSMQLSTEDVQAKQKALAEQLLSHLP